MSQREWTAKEFASAALAALAGAGICTPERGYLKDGGPALMGSDIGRLMKQRDELLAACEAALMVLGMTDFANSGAAKMCRGAISKVTGEVQ